MGSHSDQGVSYFPVTYASRLNGDQCVNVCLSGGPLIKGELKITSSYMNTGYSAMTGLNVIIGLFSSLAVNMPDFGRFSKNGLAGPHQYLALPIIGTLGALTPIFVTDAHSYLWGEFQWYVVVLREMYNGLTTD
jgi:NCS1 family nucleobase:cation symporter-1